MVQARQDEDVCVLDTVGNGQCSLTSELLHVRFLLKKKKQQTPLRVSSLADGLELCYTENNVKTQAMKPNI